MDRWKATALLAMGMMAGQLFNVACNGVQAIVETIDTNSDSGGDTWGRVLRDSNVAHAAGGEGAGRVVFEISNCHTGPRYVLDSASGSYVESSEFSQASCESNNTEDTAQCCPDGFSFVG